MKSKLSTSKFIKRYNSLKAERDYHVTDWRQCSDYIIGYKGRFLVSDNKPQRNTNILNNTAKLAARTLASGMMAGITSPARPWFKLGTPDRDLNDYGPVRVWLDSVEKKMAEIFAQSNLYRVLPSLYAEIGVFGTASMSVLKDFSNVVKFQTYTCGSYYLGLDGDNKVDTFYREYRKTVGQCVKRFGYDNCSHHIQEQWNKGNTETWIDILHAIEPNDDRDNMNEWQKKLGKNKAYRSVYMEMAKSGNKGVKSSCILSEEGFDEFPIMAPRWETTDSDTYATNCPGFDALGDTKALQLEEKRKAQAIDKVVDPPLQGPTSLRSQVYGGGFQPGTIEFVDDPSGQGLRSIYDMRPDINALMLDIQENELRIKRAFYEDLFLMLSGTDRRQITAREIEEKHEEKLLMLGPVLERLHNELLSPIIDRTFSIMQEAGINPAPPPEINGQPLRVEYISVLAQAQKLTQVGGIERVAGFAGQLSEIWPEARHKFNPHQAIDDYSQAVGINPRLIRDDKEAEQRTAQEQQAAQQAQMAESAPAVNQLSQAAANVTKARAEEPSGNIVDTIMRNAMNG